MTIQEQTRVNVAICEARGMGPFKRFNNRGEPKQSSSRKRLAWTLSVQKAKWFACRYVGPGDRPGGRVLALEVPSTEVVLGYTNDRSESEMILRPDFVREAKVKML